MVKYIMTYTDRQYYMNGIVAVPLQASLGLLVFLLCVISSVCQQEYSGHHSGQSSLTHKHNRMFLCRITFKNKINIIVD